MQPVHPVHSVQLWEWWAIATPAAVSLSHITSFFLLWTTAVCLRQQEHSVILPEHRLSLCFSFCELSFLGCFHLVSFLFVSSLALYGPSLPYATSGRGGSVKVWKFTLRAIFLHCVWNYVEVPVLYFCPYLIVLLSARAMYF
jgi:hypothetical protein